MQRTGRSARRRKRYLISSLPRLLFGILAAFLILRGGVLVYERSAYPLRYSELIERCAAQYELDPSFLYAVVHTESRFDPNALSQAGAMGLMQLTEDAFSWAQFRMGEQQALPVESLYEPQVNLQYGSFLYAAFIEEFGSVDTAVCVYHAGRSNVKSWLQNPAYSADGVTIDRIPYSNTRWYLERIKKTQAIYRRLYHLK